MKNFNHLLNLTLAISVAACSFLRPIPEKSRFFLLTPMAPGDAGAQINQQATRGLVLGLGPIKFPDYLERSEIVTRVEANRVQFSDNDHWAEPLKKNFTRVLAQNLSTVLGTQQIINFPWYSSTKVDYQVAILLDRFECDAQGNAQLAARWGINEPISGRILDRGNSDLHAPCGATVDQAVGALSQTLADFSRQIGAAVAQVSAPRRAR